MNHERIAFARALEAGFGDAHAQWSQVLIAISLISFVVGAFGGLAQKDIQRLLAYSLIANIGYALLGLAESPTCRRVALLGYFGETSAPCGNCDICDDPPETFDGTQAAQKVLSAVLRTGESYGAGHVIDVLLGNATDRIRARDAEVREAARTEALAGFEWEMTDRAVPKVVPCDCKHPQHARLVGDDSPLTHASFDFVPHRRLVGPWEQTP